MIGIGTDPHLESHTASALDGQLGLLRAELTVAANGASASLPWPAPPRWPRRSTGGESTAFPPSRLYGPTSAPAGRSRLQCLRCSHEIRFHMLAVMADSRSPDPCGLVLVDKPKGPSSFAVVRDVRHRLGARKAGHAGTLDPFATGLLLVLVGRATRLARYLVGLDKRYRTEIRLGVRTSTGDLEGDSVEQTSVAELEEIESLRGTVALPIPVASAVKIGGERAYALHRKGVAVEMPTRTSEIKRLVVDRYEPPIVELDLCTSSGTYIRSIADTMGGHCVSLRRTAVGPFSIDDVGKTELLPASDAVSFLESRDLDQEEVRLIRHGRTISAGADFNGAVALVHGDELVGIGRPSDGEIRPETVLG